MAGKQITQEQLLAAAKAYAEANGMDLVTSEDGKLRLCMGGVPSESDPIVWQEGGLFKCSDTDFGLTFSEYLHSEPVKSPERPRKTDGQVNVPATRRKAQDGALVRSDMPVRDIQVQEMTFEDIKNFLCPAASDRDAFVFLKLCQARNLNPFVGEAFLVPYEDKKSGEIKCSMIVGKEAFMRKAELHPQYQGFKAGIIVSKGDDLIYREGTFLRPGEKGEKIEGGWCEVYRKDRKEPIRSEVSLTEYDLQRSLWLQKKSTMIRKVAIVQSHREAFPSDLSGCYDASEMGQAIDADFKIEGEGAT